MGNNLEVALTKKACPVCLKEYDADIVMNTLLTKPMANKVKELHGKVIGILDEPCEECMESIKDLDAVYLIGMDPDKTESNKIEDIYRTGQIIALKAEAFQRVFGDHELVPSGLKDKFVFVDYKIIDEMMLHYEQLEDE